MKQLSIVLVAAAAALAGCGEQKPAAKADGAKGAAGGAEVRIGHVAPLTGGIAHLGKDNENGARLALDEANEAKVQIGGPAEKVRRGEEQEQADPTAGATDRTTV